LAQPKKVLVVIIWIWIGTRDSRFIEEQAAADVAVYAWAKERFERELRSEQLA
jgi:hypothetical protein